MDSPRTDCYCGVSEIPVSTPSVVCDGCHKHFHPAKTHEFGHAVIIYVESHPDCPGCRNCNKEVPCVICFCWNTKNECLKSNKPSTLEGDIFFHFKCLHCAGGIEEEVDRMKLQWLQVVILALYNLHLSGNGKRGYFRWKEHICAYIDKHWLTLFGSHRRQTSLWHGTVAGTLSSGCPEHFLSGAKDLGESGWWRLAEMKPPVLKIQTTSVKPCKRKTEFQVPAIEPTVKLEGLRSRRGKTSIQAAMELKAKRETLLEAKDIRKAKSLQHRQSRVSGSVVLDVLTPPSTTMSLKVHSDTEIKAEQPGTKVVQHSESLLDTSISYQSHAAITEIIVPDNIKKEVPDFGINSSQSCIESSQLSCLSSGVFSMKQEVDEDSQFSQASSKAESWLTEHDLKPNEILPNLLMSDDDANSDSDIEIDPCCLSPPPGSPRHMTDSPTMQEMMACIQDQSISNAPDDNTESAYQCSTPQLKSEDPSVVDSESESNSENGASDGESTEQNEVKQVGRKRKLREEEEQQVEKPQVCIPLMSLYEERQLMKKLIAVSETCQMSVELNRLKRKLIVRQLKRERGLPVFDVDAEMKRLTRNRCHSRDMTEISGPGTRGVSSRQFSGDVRILDRFQVTGFQVKAFDVHQPSFLNRLVGIEDCQLQSICSPYTTRVLKPFIRRDQESRPLKLRLLEEIKSYPHRNDPSWKQDLLPPLDYCYVRPQHIPSVNSLCKQFFWPGIDLSECLQYPDFSCVVLYRRIVIAFAFMVPDVKYNEAYISFIFTHPEWRRAGIATFMLYHLIQTCMGKDVTLHVSATNPAMLLYQRFGFKPEEFILDFYDKYFPVDSKDCKHAFFLRLRR